MKISSPALKTIKKWLQPIRTFTSAESFDVHYINKVVMSKSRMRFREMCRQYDFPIFFMKKHTRDGCRVWLQQRKHAIMWSIQSLLFLLFRHHYGLETNQPCLFMQTNRVNMVTAGQVIITVFWNAGNF